MSFILPGIGFVLSIAAIVKTGPGNSRGRSLAMAGIAVSIVSGVALSVLIYSTWTGDEGCVAAQYVIAGGRNADSAGYAAVARGLREAATKAEHDDVYTLIIARANDYEEFADSAEGGKVIPVYQDRFAENRLALDKACSRY
jgi:hypothetical protein